MTRVLITGGAGFIGSHLIELIWANTDWHITVLDNLSTGTYKRITDLPAYRPNQHRVKMVFHDLRAPIKERCHHLIGPVDKVVHLASDRFGSLEDMIDTNVKGTMNLLDYLVEQQPKAALVNVSSYGEANDLLLATYDLATRIVINSKLAVAKTVRLPNVFGERQNVSEFVPQVLRAAMKCETVEVGSWVEDWIYAKTAAEAVLAVFSYKSQDNLACLTIGGDVSTHLSTQDLAIEISDKANLSLTYSIVDRVWCLSGNTVNTLPGFKPKEDFKDSLIRTIRWSMARSHDWL